MHAVHFSCNHAMKMRRYWLDNGARRALKTQPLSTRRHRLAWPFSGSNPVALVLQFPTAARRRSGHLGKGRAALSGLGCRGRCPGATTVLLIPRPPTWRERRSRQSSKRVHDGEPLLSLLFSTNSQEIKTLRDNGPSPWLGWRYPEIPPFYSPLRYRVPPKSCGSRSTAGLTAPTN
jgi:hypothetical protein